MSSNTQPVILDTHLKGMRCAKRPVDWLKLRLSADQSQVAQTQHNTSLGIDRQADSEVIL